MLFTHSALDYSSKGIDNFGNILIFVLQKRVSAALYEH